MKLLVTSHRRHPCSPPATKTWPQKPSTHGTIQIAIKRVNFITSSQPKPEEYLYREQSIRDWNVEPLGIFLFHLHSEHLFSTQVIDLSLC